MRLLSWMLLFSGTLRWLLLRWILLSFCLTGRTAEQQRHVAAATNNSYKDKNWWGTFRAYPYVGLRCRSPDSPLLGLLWYQPTSASTSSASASASTSLASRLRHEANHDDHLDRFGWNQHDGVGYGRQEIDDPDNHVRLTIHWIQLIAEEENSTSNTRNSMSTSTSSTSSHRHHWVLRVEGEAYYKHDNQSSETTKKNTTEDLSLLWYLATPGNLTATYNTTSSCIHGDQPEAGPYSAWIQQRNDNVHPTYTDDCTNASTSHYYYSSVYFAALNVDAKTQYYNPKPLVLQELRNPTSTLPPHLFDPSSLYRSCTPTRGNQIIQQVFFNTPFGIDFHFAYDHDHDKDKDKSSNSDARNRNCISNYSSNDTSWEKVTSAIQKAKKNHFEQTFHDTFVAPKTEEQTTSLLLPPKLVEHGRSSSIMATSDSAAANDGDDDFWTQPRLQTAQYALGNMLGQITYMHGERQVYNATTDKVETSKDDAAEMTLIVPDTADHAQGYLWDEGFQQQLVRHWDRSWTLEILSSWWNQTDASSSSGWIPRQQILGQEVEWSARPTSWPQVPGTANPPSHIWILESLIHDEHNSSSSTRDDELYRFLESIQEPLQRNVDWYLQTQASEIAGFFRWSGRTERYCLASGMDDYPRAPILTTREAHLDLHVWMIVALRVTEKLSLHDNESNSEAEAQRRRRRALNNSRPSSANLTQSLLEHFWDDSHQIFDEFYYSDRDKKKIFNGHFGYLNFFPIFLRAIPTDSKQFAIAMHKLLDRQNGMWTTMTKQHGGGGGGLLSLSSHDSYFHMGDNYWTGPIWLNINYLAVSSFYHYVHDDPRVYPMEDALRQEIQEAYKELRMGLIDMVVQSFEKTGFIWEVYDGETGKGFNNHPFTGWSALIVNIMAELY